MEVEMIQPIKYLICPLEVTVEWRRQRGNFATGQGLNWIRWTDLT